MKKFRIVESRPAIQYWEYIVEANDSNEAVEKVFSGTVDATETWIEEDESEDSEFNIYPIK